jgi:hypothetical protein
MENILEVKNLKTSFFTKKGEVQAVRGVSFDIRKNEITELKKMISHFSLKREVYREYDYVCSIVEELSKGKKVALLVWGIILTAFGSLYTLISLFDNIPKEAILIILLFTFFPGIMMLIFFLMCNGFIFRYRIY